MNKALIKIASLWVKRIIEGDETYTYDAVPAKLKEMVDQLLKDAGHEELVK